MVFVEDAAAFASNALEIAGIGVILGGALSTVIASVVLLIRQLDWHRIYRISRWRLARAILVGLEFLVAADIIRTVTVQPSFSNVGVLAVIVLIRTFLSLTLEVEMNGRWPWQGPCEP
jgi:uncharacterized membrane protein